MIFVADESPFLNPFLSRLQHQLAAGIKSNMKKKRKPSCIIHNPQIFIPAEAKR